MVTQRSPRSPLLIGLYSPIPQQGKSTAAGFFKEALSGRGPDALRAKIVSFAGPVKMAAHGFLEAIGLTDVQASRAVWEEKDKTIAPYGIAPRDLFVILGTEVGRNRCGADVWVNRGMKDASLAMSRGQSVIFDDVRAPNEADAILAAGGSLIRLVRCGIEDDARRPAVPERIEGLLEGYEFAATIYNNRTKDDLRKAVLRAIQGVRA